MRIRTSIVFKITLNRSYHLDDRLVKQFCGMSLINRQVLPTGLEPVISTVKG